jgi:hypothetical protein
MFDLQADDGSVRKKTYESPVPQSPAPRPVTANKLDSAAMMETHARCMDLYVRELDRQYENRREMAIDEDFYDNIQWREEDAAILRERGQIPLVYNVISASVDWVIGTEKRARTDFKVLPRRKEQSKPAEKKTQILKYLSDVNREPFEISRAFEDAVKAGIGWIEDGVQEEDEDEALYTRYESWRNILWDSAATNLDLSDARYQFRSKWTDLDIACALFKNRKGLLELSADKTDDYAALDQTGDEVMDSKEIELEGRSGGSTTSDRITGYQRRRVRLIEAWIKIPVSTWKMVGGTFSGEVFDPYSAAHGEEIATGAAQKVKRTVMRVHVAIMTHAGMLWFSESPYRHNRFPFTPIWGNKRAKDGMPYGMIRRLRDIQEDINKRASKALHILSTNKVIMDAGAVEDIDELEEEMAKPNAIIIKNKGYDFELNVDRDLSQWHMELMSRSIAMVQQSSGVTDELLGRRTNATSGVAIGKRQDQGAMATAKYFDNLLLANQVHGEKLLANTEQFMTAEKQFRITGTANKPEWVTVNDGLPDNDIIRSKADYVISEGAWSATVRQAAADSLMEVMTRLPPDVSIVLLDLIVENMDIPNREEIVKRIRSLSGQPDPSQEEPSPEDIAKAQAANEAQQLQIATVAAQLRKLLAEAAKSEAHAAHLKAQTVGANVASQTSALGAAQQAIAIPATVPVADFILGESGFTSKSDDQLAAAAQAAAAQQPGLGQPMPAQQPIPA